MTLAVNSIAVGLCLICLGDEFQRYTKNIKKAEKAHEKRKQVFHKGRIHRKPQRNG